MGMKASKADIADLVAKGGKLGPSMAKMLAGTPTGPADGEWGKTPAKQPKGPNKLEQSYASYLEWRKQSGHIKDYGYEAIKLKIGVKRCWYTPDFWVLANDDVLEFHETKGFMRDDARVKLQSAARQYPLFRFVLVRKDLGGFSTEPIG